MKILIEIEGGLVRNVFTSRNAEIVIVDYDKHCGEPVCISGVQEPDRTSKNIFNLFDATDNETEEIVFDQLKELNF